MTDKSKIIFGNQMSAKDYKKALEKKEELSQTIWRRQQGGIFRQAG